MEAATKFTPNPGDASNSLARTVDQASAGAHEAINKVSDATRPVVDRIASGAHQAVDKIASGAGQVAESMGIKGEQLKDMHARAMDQGRGYVRDNPLMALGIAIAAGFLLSKLWGSR